MDPSMESGNTGIQPVADSVETVEVVSGTERSSMNSKSDSKMEAASTQLSVPSSGMIEIDPHALTYTLVEMANQQLAQGSSMFPPSLVSSLPSSVMSAGDPSPLVAASAGMKRSSTLTDSLGDFSEEVPRKKSRNYLDSHKNIEKKRRDRINTGLSMLKEMVPDCRQYGSKKLDKAEIIEFTIHYIKRMQAQASKRTGDIDLSSSQREWANEIMTWVFHNKLLYTGPNALEQFCNALLLNLQNYGNPPPTSLGSPSTNILAGTTQSGTSSDDESLKASLVQQLVSFVGNQSNESTIPGKTENTPNQQQIAQIQALLLLQQQQMLGQQQNPEGGGASNGTPQEDSQTQQAQLQQLQSFLLHHLTSETGHQKVSSNEEDDSVYTPGTSGTSSNPLTSNGSSLLVGASIPPSADVTTIASSVNLNSLSSTISSEEGTVASLEQPPIYTSTTLEENLLDSTETGQTSSQQMWSGQQQDSSILLEGSVPDHAIDSGVVHEEVELLTNTTQQ